MPARTLYLTEPFNNAVRRHKVAGTPAGRALGAMLSAMQSENLPAPQDAETLMRALCQGGLAARWIALDEVRMASIVGGHRYRDRAEAIARMRAGRSAVGSARDPWPHFDDADAELDGVARFG